MSTTGHDLIAVSLHDGVGRIAQERKRQITGGWTPEGEGEKAWASITTDDLVKTGARIAAEVDRRAALVAVARERH